MTFTFRRRLLASTLLVASATFATPALAQVTEPVEASPEAQEAAEGGEVIVTGSRIARPDLETSSPVNVVGQQEIQLRQATTAEGLLRDLPSVRPSIGPAVNNGSNGSATINLRGIGDNRTLVLLDSRRIVPFGLDGVTDTNVIPVALVERVDLVTGGASSVYGADAVAGVVNFITKRDFAGVQLDSTYRISERGDTARFSADLTIGANLGNGDGNAVFSIGSKSPIRCSSRTVRSAHFRSAPSMAFSRARRQRFRRSSPLRARAPRASTSRARSAR
jgi:iron complex outermembrane receptor protein